MIQTIKSCLSKYICAGGAGQSFDESDISFILSESKSPVMNYAIVNKINNIDQQRETFESKFNKTGFVLSVPVHRPMVPQICEGVRYVGKVFVCISTGFTGEPTQVNGRVEKLTSRSMADYVSFIEKQRGVEPEITEKIVESAIDDLYIYLAYSQDEVVAAGSAIKDGQSIFIFDTVVDEEKRNEGYFSGIVTRSMSDVSKSGRYNYYAIVSSPMSLAGASKANYERNIAMDLWIKE